MPPRSFPLGNPFGGAGAGQPQGPPSIDISKVNQLLAQYGVSLPTGGFSDAGPMQQAEEAQNSGQGSSIAGHLLANHPQLARGLDNALIGAALTKPSRTAGEGISNVAQAVLGINPYRQQLAAQKAQVPLEFAKEIGGLQAQQAMMQMYSGMGDYYRAQGQARLEQSPERLQAALMRANMEGAMKPRIGWENGAKVAQTAQIDDQGHVQWKTDPSLDVHDLELQDRRQQGGMEYQAMEAQFGLQPDPTKDPAGSISWAHQAMKFHQQWASAPGIAGRSFGNQLPPSNTDLYNKFADSSKLEANKLVDKGVKFDQKAFAADLDNKLRAAGKGYRERQTQVNAQVMQEEQRRQAVAGQISDAFNDFANPLKTPPDAQMKYGSFGNYLQQTRQFDPNSYTMGQAPSPQAVQNMQQGVKPGPSPMPQQTTNPGTGRPNASAPTPFNMSQGLMPPGAQTQQPNTADPLGLGLK